MVVEWWSFYIFYMVSGHVLVCSNFVSFLVFVIGSFYFSHIFCLRLFAFRLHSLFFRLCHWILVERDTKRVWKWNKKECVEWNVHEIFNAYSLVHIQIRLTLYRIKYIKMFSFYKLDFFILSFSRCSMHSVRWIATLYFPPFDCIPLVPSVFGVVSLVRMHNFSFHSVWGRRVALDMCVCAYFHIDHSFILHAACLPCHLPHIYNVNT